MPTGPAAASFSNCLVGPEGQASKAHLNVRSCSRSFASWTVAACPLPAPAAAVLAAAPRGPMLPVTAEPQGGGSAALKPAAAPAPAAPRGVTEAADEELLRTG